MRIMKSLRSSFYVRKLAENTLFNPSFINTNIYSLVYSRVIKSRISYLTKLKRPKNVIIENTNICNARCQMCPYELMNRKKEHMSMSLFVNILHAASKAGIPHITLCGYGEPLTDPFLLERLDSCKSLGITVSFYTNASLLTEERAHQLISHGLHHINISFDSLNKEKFESLRRNLHFERVLTNIASFIAIRNKSKAKTSILITAKDFNMENLREIREFYSFWQDRIDPEMDVVDVGFTDERRNAEAFGYDIKRKNVEFRFPCVILWTTLVVMVNGDVVLCNFDYDGAMVIGNLGVEDIAEVWEKKMQVYREMHLNNQQTKIRICKNCRYFPNWWLPY